MAYRYLLIYFIERLYLYSTSISFCPALQAFRYGLEVHAHYISFKEIQVKVFKQRLSILKEI